MTLSNRYPSLAGRTVFISGGTTGIGTAFVEQFHAQGARVGFVGRNADAAEALLAHIAQGAHAAAAPAPLFTSCDVTDIEALRAAIARTRGAFGPVSVLVNNAANDMRHRIEDTTPASWDAGIAVNLRHQFFAAQAVMPDMVAARAGSIVNLGSVSWMLKQGGMPVYTTAKSAVQGLTRSLARDLGRHGIRCNTVVPGWVMTERQLKLWWTPESQAEVAKSQCIAAPLQPWHIASMVLFLAADDSAMCTAQDFIVDAGCSARSAPCSTKRGPRATGATTRPTPSSGMPASASSFSIFGSL